MRLIIPATRLRLRPSVLALGFALAALAAPLALHAQARPPMQVQNPAALRPPAGARVAIVAFANMQCPACASANPILRKAANTYHIPLVHHDVDIPSHNWAQQAAINARWFDTKTPGLGDAYRDQVFASQISIYSPLILNQFTQKFAAAHGLQLPFALDPQGRLQSALQADYALSNRTGVRQTPTIFVVSAGGRGAPYTEVTDLNTLYQVIDQALANSQAPTAAPKAKPAHK